MPAVRQRAHFRARHRHAAVPVRSELLHALGQIGRRRRVLGPREALELDDDGFALGDLAFGLDRQDIAFDVDPVLTSPGYLLLKAGANVSITDKAGATGYLVKSASRIELAEAVRATAAGRAVFTPGLAGLVLGEYRRIAARPGTVLGPTLTERETEVLRHVAKGMTAKQIAAKLSVSHRTVENHVQATLGKLQLANRVELTRYAIEHGLEETE